VRLVHLHERHQAPELVILGDHLAARRHGVRDGELFGFDDVVESAVNVASLARAGREQRTVLDAEPTASHG